MRKTALNGFFCALCLVSGIAGCAFVLLSGVSSAFAADAEVKLDSNDGSTKFIVRDRDAAAVFSADSDGNTVIGGTAAVAGSGFSVGGSTLVVKAGRVGIGTATPVTALDVNGGVRVGNYISASTPSPAGLAGTFIFNTTTGKPYVSNGAAWKPLDSDLDGDGVTDAVDVSPYNAADATAVAADVLAGKTLYAGGAARTGTMPAQALSAANETVGGGYYAATTLSAVDTDLAAGNIKSGVTIFGKAGTLGGPIPDTGQTTSYDAGDDAAYNPAGTQLSYTVNGDNTVTDNRTGLMWRRCSQGKNDDATCTGTALTYNLPTALAQCEDETADYSDWRLPNVKELLSLMKFEGSNPCIDATAFPNTVGANYWTSTTSTPGCCTYAVDVNFGLCSMDNNTKTATYQYVRCVRAGP